KDAAIPLEQDGIRALLAPAVRKVALANPKFAPYGQAAQAALEKLGVYEPLKDKLVFGDNVAQTAQFVQTGAADAGFLSLSLALGPVLRASGRYWEIPVDAYPLMEQGGAVLSWAKNRPAAEALRDFVIGAEGKAILRRYG